MVADKTHLNMISLLKIVCFTQGHKMAVIWGIRLSFMGKDKTVPIPTKLRLWVGL